MSPPSLLRKALIDLSAAITADTGIPAYSEPDKMTPVTGLSVALELTRIEWRHATRCGGPADLEVDAHLIATGSDRNQVARLLDELAPVADAIRRAGWGATMAALPSATNTDTIPMYTITATKIGIL